MIIPNIKISNINYPEDKNEINNWHTRFANSEELAYLEKYILEDQKNYSLGDFIYQGLVVEELPADFKEKFNIDINASAYEALMARAQGGGVGLHCFKNNYQSLLPKIDYENGVIKKITLAPLYLNFDKKDEYNGLPTIAKDNEAKEIYELITQLSNPYGTKFSFDGKYIYIEI